MVFSIFFFSFCLNFTTPSFLTILGINETALLDDILACAHKKEIGMSITAEKKAAVLKEFATKDGDTGSPEVQIAILSSRIATLTEHFKIHKKDNHSRRGLLKLVALRRKLLDYTRGKSEDRYQNLIKSLGLRR